MFRGCALSAYYPGYDAKTDKIGDIQVEWVTTPSDNNAYQDKLDADLKAQGTSSDPIDIFLIEADYALKYVNFNYTLDVKKDIGLTDSDLANQYQYINMKNISKYDQGLNEEFQKAFKDYFDGNVTKDVALSNFYKAAIEKYPNLKKPS